ncbi:MAG: hypothetical protein CVU81_00940 [Euryarchaeota archaeon HGW-Euryarchaeota-1]|nr:MAG: hypothetical protein CVU81_00940 [Euryarchaeota archaeon HGW-Euryarchaeota-1]
MVSAMCAYALGKHLSDATQKQATIVFDALENGPGEKKEIEGIVYQRMLCDTYKDGKSLSDTYLPTFKQLFSDLSKQSGIPHEIRFYKELQANPVARETLITLLSEQNKFVPVLNPSDDRLKVRFKCPKCNYEEKHARTLEFSDHIPYEKIALQNTCFEHGKYKIALEKNNKDFVDVNTMVRNVMKESVIINKSKKDNYFPLLIKGADWAHATPLVSNALEMLGYSVDERPHHIFTPIVEDWSGAKFSKSVYVESNTYNKLSKGFISYDNYLSEFGEKSFENLFDHVCSWVKDPKKFYRNYSLEYMCGVCKI